MPSYCMEQGQMTIIYAIITIWGAILNPHLPLAESVDNALYCLQQEPVTIHCAIEFADHVSTGLQTILRGHLYSDYADLTLLLNAITWGDWQQIAQFWNTAAWG